MLTPDLLTGIAGSLGLLLCAIAAWMLHRRVRTRSSAAFAWLSTAMCVWPFIASPAFAAVVYYAGNPLPQAWANALGLAIDQIIPMLLTLASAVLFLLAVRGIAHRNSPAPK